MNFKNKVVFVTGAVKGIERATIVALSAFGCKVVAADIDFDALKILESDIVGLKTTTIEIKILDVADVEQVKSVLS